MKKLAVLFALVLSTTAAWAQAEKAQIVTKLPGEEKLSTRERAERDFLMPVRRKKAADLARPTASAEQLASAAPETDYSARYHEAPADPRPEEVAAPAHAEATATRSRATRHAAWLAARREARAAEARHTSKARRSSHSKTTKARRAKETRAARHASKATRHAKAAPHKASKSRANTKKTVRHAATHKARVKTKAKATPARHKHRR